MTHSLGMKDIMCLRAGATSIVRSLVRSLLFAVRRHPSFVRSLVRSFVRSLWCCWPAGRPNDNDGGRRWVGG